VVALSVILFPPLLIAFLLVMERVEEPLRRPASPREVTEFLSTATAGEVDGDPADRLTRTGDAFPHRSGDGWHSRLDSLRTRTPVHSSERPSERLREDV
jgi:hypothetical protein